MFFCCSATVVFCWCCGRVGVCVCVCVLLFSVQFSCSLSRGLVVRSRRRCLGGFCSFCRKVQDQMMSTVRFHLAAVAACRVRRSARIFPLASSSSRFMLCVYVCVSECMYVCMCVCVSTSLYFGGSRRGRENHEHVCLPNSAYVISEGDLSNKIRTQVHSNRSWDRKKPPIWRKNCFRTEPGCLNLTSK